MLKKAGIVAAATTAALLAISPLAFAGDAGNSNGGNSNGGGGNGGPAGVSIDDSQVNKCTAEQTNAPLSILNVNNLLQCTNALNKTNVQVAVIGSNTNS